MRAEFHAKAPLCAAFVSAVREAFGEENVKADWVREGEVSLGKIVERAWVPVTYIAAEDKGE